MRIIIVTWFTVVASFVPLACVAQNKSVSANDSSMYVEGSLCTRPDKIVFSCPLGKSEKIVSICASNKGEQDRFYYSFGREKSPELILPAKADYGKTLSSARLRFAGASGGIAYSITNAGYKYIAYHISGTGFENGGLMVVNNNGKSEVVNLKCKPGRISDSVMNASNDAMYNKISHLPQDQDLTKENLPFAPKD